MDATLNDSSEDNALSDKEFTLNLISIYRDLPVLWRVKSKAYKDENKRNAAIKNITNVLKICRRNITEEEVKNEINILRTNFKSENNKVRKSMLSGSSAGSVYVPSLWYYKELDFLQDQMEGESRISAIIDQQESSSTPIPSHSFSQSVASTNSAQSKKRKKEDLEYELMVLVKDYFEKPETECQAVAQSWALKLERLCPIQRRLAEKFVNEILFEAEDGNLHIHSVIINPSPGSHTRSPDPQESPSPIEQSYLSE